MAAEGGTIEGTAAPREHAGLPQMDPSTFPSQLFWLVVTFGLLFLVLWRVTLPRIAGVIGDRRNRIEGDLETAEKMRNDASEALKAYETSLGTARGSAMAMADENRKRVAGEIDAMKAAADRDSQNAMSAAETRIAAERARAEVHVRAAAGEAAAAIVERLIGDTVGPEDALRAVGDAAAERG
jgi:F-type H+-transporting ATPase subunit b